jgi:5-methylthioadenosine/S-adenosylhomocysteine deaminase
MFYAWLQWEAPRQSICGGISVGKKADLIVISTKDIGMTPWKDPLGLIVLYAHPSHVDTVFVGGKVMKRNGKLVGVNWEEVRAHLLKSSEAIVQRSQTYVV